MVGERSAADNTRATYDSRWSWWVHHCESLHVDPLAAPFSAFTALFTEATLGGRPLSPSTIDVTVAAVASHYSSVGLTPAHQDPRHAGDWRSLRRGYERSVGAGAGRGSARPLMRDDLLRMLTATPEWLEPSSNRTGFDTATALLLAWDTGLSVNEIVRLTWSDTRVDPDGSRVLDRAITCRHEDLVSGVRWDCAHCFLLSRSPYRDIDADAPLIPPAHIKPLMLSLQTRRFTQWGAISRDGRTRQTFVGIDDSVSDWQRAGARRGLVLSSLGPTAVAWVQARFLYATAWSAGLRVVDTFPRTDWSNLRPRHNGDGWRLMLGASKSDARGVNTRAINLPWGNDEARDQSAQLSLAGLAVEWAAVREAAVGAVDVVWTPVARGALSQLSAKPKHRAQVFAQHLLTMLEIPAGYSPGTFTPHSARRGYGTQSDRDGRDILDIQQGLGHSSLDTTARYVKREDTKVATRQLLDRINGYVA